MTILNFLLYAVFLLFPFGNLLRFDFENGIAIQAIEVILLGVTLIILFKIILKRIHLSSLPLISYSYGFVGVAFCSLVLNASFLTPVSFAISASYLLRFILYLNLSYALYLAAWPLKKTVQLLVCSGLGAVLFGFVQYLIFPDLRPLEFLGWDQHLYRMFSTYFDPNFAAAIFVLVFLLLLYYLFSHNVKNKKITYIIIVLCIVTTAALFLTYSRSGYIMFVCAAFSFLWLSGKRKIIVLLMSIFVAGLIIVPKHSDTLRSEGVDLFRTNSIYARGEQYQNALNIIIKNPILGVGFNAYRYAQTRYGFFSEDPSQTSHAGAGVPNSYLLLLATTGFAGAGVFLLWMFKMIRYVAHVTSPLTTPVKPLFYSSFISVAIHSLFENTFFYPFILLWLFVLLGAFLEHKKTPNSL
jgi:O-antigen ligase